MASGLWLPVGVARLRQQIHRARVAGPECGYVQDAWLRERFIRFSISVS